MKNSNTASIFFSFVLSFTILIIFIRYYTIPPLIDFQAHVALGMIKGALLQYYQYNFSLTYRLLDSIVRFWTFFLGNDYAQVMLTTYISVMVLLFCTVYFFCILREMTWLQSLGLMSILAGPIFLLLHCTMFIWGVIPFTLAVFMAAASSAALWHIDNEIINQTAKWQTKALFSGFSLLAIYSHPVGMIYLIIGWLVPLARIFFVGKKQLNRFLFPGLLFGFMLFILMSAIITPAGAHQFFSLIHDLRFFSWHPERIKWLMNGGPYDLFGLIPVSEQGNFKYRSFRILLTLVPYGILVLLVVKGFLSKKWNNWQLFLIFQLVVQLLLMFFLPENWGELVTLFSRQWLFVCAFAFMGMVYCFYELRPHIIRIIYSFSPLLTAVSCYLLMPLYANFRLVPIEKVANDYTPSLLKEVSAYKNIYPEMNKAEIVIDYKPHMIERNWVHYHMVPFIMTLSPELINHKIIIREHWNYASHIAVSWRKKQPDAPVFYLYWTKESGNKIQLNPSNPAFK